MPLSDAQWARIEPLLPEWQAPRRAAYPTNKLKQRRGLATRYDKTATIYLAGLHLAGIFIWSAR
jgi:transposase